MIKPLLVIIAVLSPSLYLAAQNDSVRAITETQHQTALVQLEYRKLELEERKLYLSTLQGSRITEQKAQELSGWILRNLKDYPQGKRAKHFEEDRRVIVEAVASLQKLN